MRKWKGTVLCQIPQEILWDEGLLESALRNNYKRTEKQHWAEGEVARQKMPLLNLQAPLELRWPLRFVLNQSKGVRRAFAPWINQSVLSGLREGAISWAGHLLSAKGCAWSLTQMWIIRGQHSQQLGEWVCWPWMEDSGVSGYPSIH